MWQQQTNTAHGVCVWRDEETAAFLELLHEINCGQEGNATQYQELPPLLLLLLLYLMVQ